MESRPPKRPFPFSINDILTTPPPPKKLRQGFLINQLLGLTVQEGEGAETSSKKKLPSEFVEKLECSVEHIAKFHYTKVQSRFVIRDVPADPEGLLSSIFKHCIDEAKSDSREKSSEPTHLGCLISSALLASGDVFVPVRQITANTIDTILNLFTKVAQSKQQKGVTLWGEPFTITITTVDRSRLPAKRHLKGGARRRLAPVRHQITEKCLIKIRNQDNFCLFYALQATMVAKTHGLSRSAFYEYIHGRYGQRGKFQEETQQLMRRIRAPFNLDNYDADTYVPRVIEHWNNTQQQYRLAVFIFGASGHYKPLYKYGPADYNTPLILYFNNNHFDGVQFVSGLFAGKKYCLACERPYSRPSLHDQSCKAHCMLCSRVGPEFPCSASPSGFFKKCDGCNKVFRNNACHQHHIQSNFCNLSKKCKDCGVIWNVNDFYTGIPEKWLTIF
ncbi:hypothetical protein niasHT_014538 [Heterodera trifolii]|uniref:C2H2-type domain-containing protein n=1 Tax=Heterodera trifolii TaxID=157864 RepID=A0ABD2L368_9BILA